MDDAARRGRSGLASTGLFLALLAALPPAACDSSQVSGKGAEPSAKATATSSPVVSATTPPGASASWTAVSAPPGTADFVFAQAAPSRGFLCVNYSADPQSATSPTFYTSADGGHSWSPVASAPRTQPPAGQTFLTQLPVLCRVFQNVNAPGDVFLQQAVIEPVGAGHAVARGLHRTQDGGKTWATLGTVDQTDGFDALVVVGTRLIGQVHPSVYGASACTGPATNLHSPSLIYASDDGGTTWQPIGQDIVSQGFAPRELAAAGNIVKLVAVAQASDPCHTQPTSTFWASADGGKTWQKQGTQTGVVGDLSFTFQAIGDEGYQGVALVQGTDTALAQGAGGAWKALPALDPGQSGIDPNTSEWDAIAATPNGAVIAEVAQSGGAGPTIFSIRPGDTTPSWRAYAAGGYASWQIVRMQTATLWALGNPGQPDAELHYLPLP